MPDGWYSGCSMPIFLIFSSDDCFLTGIIVLLSWIRVDEAVYLSDHTSNHIDQNLYGCILIFLLIIISPDHAWPFCFLICSFMMVMEHGCLWSICLSAYETSRSLWDLYSCFIPFYSYMMIPFNAWPLYFRICLLMMIAIPRISLIICFSTYGIGLLLWDLHNRPGLFLLI